MATMTKCACAHPLPPLDPAKSWTCGTCNGERQYEQGVSIGRGGGVARCGDCVYDVRQTGLTVPLTLCRIITIKTLLAGMLPQTETYFLCDTHCDYYAERARKAGAPVVDGRAPANAEGR